MQDVDKLELLAEGLNELVDVGEQVMADGKLSWSDLDQADELYNAVKKVAVKAYKELGEEIKDADAVEVTKVISKLLERK
jgi:hypothetical protein